MTTPSPLEWLDAHEGESLRHLDAFLRIPSVSTDRRYAQHVAEAADWLCRAFGDIGLTASLHRTDGHPIVLGEWRSAPPGAPTILIYGHYDVQPPEPLEEWTSPPFEPQVRNDRLYARGAVDDKGQLWIHATALRAHLATRGRLPVNVIFLVEGEEEVGGANLTRFVRENAERLACDAVVISDTVMFAEGMPSILASLRGIAYFDVVVTGANTDLHSGQYGGIVPNPATGLAHVIASLHDSAGRVAIDGFYDEVAEISRERKARLAALPFDAAGMARELNIAALTGEDGFSPLERLWLRPTCEVNGLLSGYTGEGAKTVLPRTAMAKVSCRLVSGQTPERIEALVKKHVASVTPQGLTSTVTMLHGGLPWSADPAGPVFDAAMKALSDAFGTNAVVAGGGGSIPIVSELEAILHAPVFLVGFGLPGENAHAPDEWISLDNFRKGSRAIALFLDALGALPRG